MDSRNSGHILLYQYHNKYAWSEPKKRDLKCHLGFMMKPTYSVSKHAIIFEFDVINVF